jgi:hypothetical protein
MATIAPNLRDVLPDLLINLIRDRYLAGVSDAAMKFPYSEGDEDSLTGALGQAISTPGPLTVNAGGDRYTYNISYRKLRGRGSGAPEKKLGADGIFQIDVTNNEGAPVVRKGLPFQAKKRWSKPDKKLVEQARKMLNSAGDGLIIDFSPLGYSACSALDAIQSEGRISAVKASGRLRDLGHVFADDFLECSIGVEGLYYDPIRQIFAYEDSPAHTISTEIKILKAAT